MARAKHWCFTLNNYSEANQDELRILFESEGVVYLVFGRETGEQGTPHLQGFISLATRKTFNQIKSFLPDGAHIEKAHGTPSQASSYCKKDGDFEEFGDVPGGQGRRTDIAAVADRIKEGASYETIFDEFPGPALRYRRSIQEAIRDRQPVRNWAVNVIILWGRSGTGKTRSIWDFHDHATIYVHPGDRWFDGYTGQEIVLFDDFSGSEFKLSYLLKLLDRYPMRVPVKGGFVQWAPKVIYFTSNKDPKQWYANALEEHQNALFRRVNTITHFP